MSAALEKVNIIPEAGPVSHIPAPVSETAAVMSMIERAARDPSVDMAKLERLMEMSKTIREQEAERAFNESMAAIQGKMRAVAADANNPQTRSKYASYFALDKAIRAIYSAEGFGLSFNTEDSPKAEHVRVVCYVTRGSHTRKYHVDMPADGKGAKGGDVMTKTHAVGSAMTYGQRYLLKMIFNIAIGEDDDGNAATNDGATINQDQLSELVALADEVGADKRAFCKYMGVESFAALPAKSYERAKTALNRKRGAQ